MKRILLPFSLLAGSVIMHASAQPDTVVMGNNFFEPENLSIVKGQTVVWLNQTEMQHTSTSGIKCSPDKKWDSEYLLKGETYSHTFNEAGEFQYYCIPHCLAGMTGIITVQPGEKIPIKKKTEKTDEKIPPKKRKINHIGFKGIEVINSPSVNTLEKGILDFTVFHRFDDLTGDKGGPQVLFGLDNLRDFRLALSYGVLKKITIGLARNKGDWFNAPYQEIKNLYEGNIKINFINQDSGKFKLPFSLSLYSNTVYSAMKKQNDENSEANFNNFTDRFSHSGLLLLSYNFPKYISLQLIPIYLRRNWINTCREITLDELDLFSLGGAVRFHFSERIGLLAEYYYVFSDYRQQNQDVFSNPLSFAFEINTGGHLFHINLSNSTGIIPNTFIPYTTSSWLKNGYRLGFSIARKFIIDKNQN